MQSLDSAIISVYREFDTPADQIVSDPLIDQEFGQHVNRLLPPNQQVQLDTLNKRLLNLRRKGEEKGGLPRLRRR